MVSTTNRYHILNLHLTMLSIHPYLVFPGTCEEAFTYYNKVFASENLYIGHYKDAPPEAKSAFPNANDEHVMHATLQIDEKTVIMGNDSADIQAEHIAPARDFYLYLDAGNANNATRIFNELSVGGKVIMPIVQTFWASSYGIVTDKFGINWKITAH